MHTIIVDFLMHASKCLNPMLCAIGLLAAIWAARTAKRKTYLLIGLYFLLSLYSLSAAPYINRMIAERRAPDISKETERKIDLAVQEAIDRTLAEAGHPVIVHRETIYYRLDLIVLALGVLMLAAQDITRVQQDHGASSRRLVAAALALLAIGFLRTACQVLLYDSDWGVCDIDDLGTRWISSSFSAAIAVVIGIIIMRMFRSNREQRVKSEH